MEVEQPEFLNDYTLKKNLWRGRAKEEQCQSVILFLLYLSIADKKKKEKKEVWHTPKDYLQVYNMTAQRSTSPSVKLDNKENV